MTNLHGMPAGVSFVARCNWQGFLLFLALCSFGATGCSAAPPLTQPLSAHARPLEPNAASVLTGLDVLEREGFARLRGRRVGVVCNATAIDRRGRHIVDEMAASRNVHLIALFGPEHGIRGGRDSAINSSVDSKTGLPVYSLYNDNVPEAQRYRPTGRMLRGIDTLVFDIQDIGVRYYTYITTLGYVLEEAARHHIRVLVLDRPNPLGGIDVEGPDLDLRYHTFAGYHNMPITHGMTVGELARLFNRERSIGADLEVVPMQGWNRQMIWEDTGLPWVNPSPNIHNAREATLYAGIGFLEDLPLSVGRGTRAPFEVVGAPWLDSSALAREMNQQRLPGFHFQPHSFVPGADKYAGRVCTGMFISITDRRQCRPTEMGIYLLHALSRHYPGRINGTLLHKLREMIGNQAIPQAIAAGVPPSQIIQSWQGDVQQWRRRRAPFLLYR